MSNSFDTEKIIRSHVLWAMGGGLIPIPLVDFAAVTAIQLDMLKQLADYYGVNYSQNNGKQFVSALTGTTFASIGASVLKAIPGIGTVLGGVSMSVMSGASTYAVGQVAVNLFSDSRALNIFDEEEIKKAYNAAYERGKSYVSDLKNEQKEAANIYQSLEQLGKLKQQGIISDEEFEQKKKELLARI